MPMRCQKWGGALLWTAAVVHGPAILAQEAGEAAPEWAETSDPYAIEPAADSEAPPDTLAESADADANPLPVDESLAAVDLIPVQPLQPEAEPPVAEEPQAAQLEEIVVTARKRQESIQEVPVSVAAFGAREMEQRGFVGLEDIAAATPGFTFEPFITGGAHGNPVIRGLAQQFTTTRVQNVSFFLDGVYLQRQSMLNLGLIDIERVEVVKGPQNALYGRSAFAGAVNYVTQKPSDQFSGYLSAGFGDNQRREVRGSVSGALDGEGMLFGKVTVGYSNYDGHTPNDHPLANANPPGPNLRGNLGGFDDRIYSVSIAYEPMGGLRLRASYYNSEQVHETAPGYSISGVNAARFGLRFDDQNDLNCNLATVPDIQPFPQRTHTGFSAYCGELPAYASDIAPRTKDGIIIDPRAIGTLAETEAVTFVAHYDLTEFLTANYLFGYADHSSFTDGGVSDEDPLAGRGIVTNALITSIDNQNPDGYEFINTSSSRPNSILEAFSHELRFDWQFSDRLRTSFGGYLSTVEDEEWTALFINDLCNDDNEENRQNCNEPLSAPNTLEERTVITSGVVYDQYTRQHGGDLRGEYTAFKDDIYAVFASFAWAFTDRLEGTIEARYTIEDREVERFTDAFALAPGETVSYRGNPRVVPFAGDTLTSGIAVPRDDERFDNLTPRAIIDWAWADRSSVYFSVAKGVKAGGFNNANSEAELTYEQEESWAYELGSKNRLFDGRMTFNVAFYYVDQTKLQGGVPPEVAGLSTSDIITNIGGATSLGVEIESDIALTEAFTLDVNASYSDPKYKEGVKFAAGDQETGRVRCDGVTCPADGDIGGNQLSRSSKFQYSLGINYTEYFFGWLARARVDTTYQSRQFVEPLNLAWVPERQLYNASFNAASPNADWEFTLWGKNLTDEDYAASAFFIGVFNQYMVGKGARRTLGATLKYNF